MASEQVQSGLDTHSALKRFAEHVWERSQKEHILIRLLEYCKERLCSFWIASILDEMFRRRQRATKAPARALSVIGGITDSHQCSRAGFD